nr:metal ABC transporter substrate-binding protein [Mobilisporobacter senegalensis]
MLRKWVILSFCLVAAISFYGCSNKNSQEVNTADKQEVNTEDKEVNTDEKKVKVSVSFNALKEFAEAVGKDKVEVQTIISDGIEPHDFEPKAQDLAKLSEAEIFVYNGLGMEAWADEAVKAANNEKLIVIEASEGADVITNEEHEEEEHEEEDEHEEEEHDHGKYDPHLWLSLKGAQTEVINIKEALVKADPDNKDYYEKNCNDYISQLENLYNEYNEKFQSLKKKTFVTGHAAFAYLCRDFGLEQNSVEDVFAEGEPSAKQLTELVEFCKENEVKTIFAEEMASPEVSKTLANEIGAGVETIYTMENNEDDMTYLERMTANLTKIYESLAK